MYDLSQNISAVQAFPNDNKIRVVWAFGALIKNLNGTTNVPEVEVLLREVVDGNVTNNEIIIKIAMAQVDIVRLFTIWQGRRRTIQYWTHFKKYEQNQNFSFNFSNYKPESIKYKDVNPASGYPYFAPYKYNLRAITKLYGYHYHFNNATYTKLTTDNGIIVLIPSFEMLTSTYVPFEQYIRNELVKHPIDYILSKYIDAKSTYMLNNEYHMKFYDNKADSNISFLSYAKFNEVTRQRLTLLRNSLETGNKHNNRYPIVLPYHPENMQISSDGMWLDDKTFFVFRIDGYSLPTENKIIVHHMDYRANNDKPTSSNNGRWRTYPPDIKNYDIPFTNNHRPHNNNGVIHILSEVRVLNRDIPNIKRDIIRIEPETSYLPISSNVENEVDGVSSGEPNGAKDSSQTAGAKIDENKIDSSHLNQANVLMMVIEVLKLMKDKKINITNDDDNKAYIENILFVDEQCNLSNSQMATQFFRVTKSNKQWVNPKGNIERKIVKLGYRNYVLIKVILNDGRFVYIFEIDRKSKGESFKGFIFNFHGNEIDINTLVNFLNNVIDNEGQYDEESIRIEKYMTFKHHIKNDTIFDNIRNTLIRANNKGLFI